ncbi:hypothetical protein AB9E11_35710, partial [Rhizobium leguminosarum]
ITSGRRNDDAAKDREFRIGIHEGDTIWSNTHAAYESLPASLKLLAENLWAIHSNAYDYAAVRPRAAADGEKHFEEVFTSTIYETEH